MHAAVLHGETNVAHLLIVKAKSGCVQFLISSDIFWKDLAKSLIVCHHPIEEAIDTP